MGLHQKLNEQQLNVVSNIGGILRVVSGPGTGKSTTCVYYIAEIINSKKAGAENILAVTFTNKTAKELKERIRKMVGKSPDVSTIHSFCAAVLRKYPPPGYTTNFTIMDEGGQFITVSNLLRQLGSDKHPRLVLEKLTLARNLRDKKILREEELDDFYKVYMTNLQQRDVIDYDGLLTWCLYIFEKNSQALEFFRHKYRYVLVDEFQDTSPIQLAVIKLLVEKNKNLMVVGDPDQSIYRFRGADVNIMVNLDEVFPNIKTFYLSQNYRSTKSIVGAAGKLIENNQTRLNKPLWTERGQGVEPEVLNFADETQEAEYVATHIETQVKNGSKYEDFAILYRVNFLGNQFETLFSGRQIPYQIVGGTGYYQRAEIKNILAFFKLVQEPTDNEAFLRACAVLAQVNGASTRHFKNKFQATSGLTLVDIAYQAQEDFIRELPDFLNQLTKQKDLVSMYQFILEKTKYLEYLQKDNSTEGERRVENLEELKSILVKLQNSGKGLNDFLEMIANIREEEDKNSVKLLTIHAAKGLEFKTVFVIGAEKGMYPHFKAENEADLEEERRLFYVAVTRAKDEVIITYPQEKIVKGENRKLYPSPYINELNLSANNANSKKTKFSRCAVDPTVTGIKHGSVAKDDISEGSLVYHPAFGKGYIMEIKESSSQTVLKTNFSGVLKDLILEYAPLKVL